MSASELLKFRDDFPQGKARLEITPATFRLADYRAFLAENASDIAAFKSRQQDAFEAERGRWEASGRASQGADAAEAPAEFVDALPQGSVAVASPVSGSIWAINVATGARVEAGTVLMVVEAMKMEFAVVAPVDGVIAELRCAERRTVSLGQILAVLVVDRAQPEEI